MKRSTLPKKTKRAPRPVRVDEVKPAIAYNVNCGPGLRSWRLWGMETKGRWVEIGRCAAFGPMQALTLSAERAKPYGKGYFASYQVEDLDQPKRMTITIQKHGPAAQPSFTLMADGVPFATGPVADGPDFARALDIAARVAGYANVALALAHTVSRVSDIDNAPNPLPLVTEG